MYILLEDAKHHLNVDMDFKDDDIYISSLIEVAEKVVERNIDTKLSDLEDSEGYLPSPLIQAMLLLIGNFYMNRESVAFANTVNVPYSYQYLIDLYRNYRGENKKKMAFLKCRLHKNKANQNIDEDTNDNEDDNNEENTNG